MDSFELVIASAFFVFSFLIALWARSRMAAAKLRRETTKLEAEVDALKTKYKPIISLEGKIQELERVSANLSNDNAKLSSQYREKLEHLKELEKQIALFEESLAFAELGLYEPHFEFTDRQDFKDAINEVRTKQKSMITSKTATVCPTRWTVEGSESKGKTMINRQSKLSLRAFNSECDAAIANVHWNNAVAMEKRILNAANQINKANQSMSLVLSEEYVALKLQELRLNHEYKELQKREREERADMARAEREERKLQLQAEEAEKEEQKYMALLNKARAEAGSDKEKIEELEAALAEAHAKQERALAMAEVTKSGYVYVISNIGSFGEDIVKIGLTRRIDPDDRVRELGDASVPFTFDTHAMIYSDDAPALENALHREFHDRRVNASNMRKEFFYATLTEIEIAVKRLAPDANFFKDREAQEWQETLARRNRDLLLSTKPSSRFPADI